MLYSGKEDKLEEKTVVHLIEDLGGEDLFLDLGSSVLEKKHSNYEGINYQMKYCFSLIP